jgi:hypothetical protein
MECTEWVHSERQPAGDFLITGMHFVVLLLQKCCAYVYVSVCVCVAEKDFRALDIFLFRCWKGFHLRRIHHTYEYNEIWRMKNVFNV